MKNYIIHQITGKNYERVNEALHSSGLPDNLLAELREIISEHQFIVQLAKKVRNKQTREIEEFYRKLNEKRGFFDFVGEFDDAKNKQTANSSQVNKPDNDSENEGNLESDSGNISDTVSVTKPLPSRPLKKRKIIPSRLIDNQKTCPCCNQKMHLAHKKFVTIIRLEGFSEERHEIETARCLRCDTKVEAASPEEKTICNFTLSAASMIICSRYIYGIPSYRFEDVSASLGYRVPDSTQWDIFENAANSLVPLFKHMEKEAAQSTVVHLDDTTARINQIQTEFKIAASLGHKPERTGIHATGFVGKTADNQTLVIFKTGLHHAGEILETLFDTKDAVKEMILMCDASSSNTSKLPFLSSRVLQTACNSHSVRKFKDFANHPLFEDDVMEILKIYSDVFERDLKLREWSPEQRLLEHQKHSLPQMESICLKIKTDLESKRVEPNSELGKVYNYFLNHYDKLIGFCRYAGAPICNNICERVLKRAILHRKNSLFFKNLVGAAVGDIHMSILITARENGIDPKPYMNCLLENQGLVRQNPKDWLPWNFAKTLQNLIDSAPP